MMQALDGAFGGGIGVLETEHIEGDSAPKRRTCGLQDDFTSYDPNK